jgi:hypothetical protein
VATVAEEVTQAAVEATQVAVTTGVVDIIAAAMWAAEVAITEAAETMPEAGEATTQWITGATTREVVATGVITTAAVVADGTRCVSE